MCLNPLKIVNPRRDFDSRFDRKTLYVPCGHCWQCLQSRQYDYEKRAVSEFHDIFKIGSVWNYTLTYKESCVPSYLGVNVLCRRDMQLFKKRLKKRFGDDGDKIQVLYTGEYGDEHDRPHWHILIYCTIPDVTPFEMYHNVQLAWTKLIERYKGVFIYENLGFVGLPSKWLDGKLLPYIPENALLDNVHGIRYCIKYIFKSFNFYNSLLLQFTHSLKSNYGLTDDEIKNFVFPQDSRFHFPDKELSLQVISNYFSKCYRSPINFGMSQQKYLNDNYEMETEFFDDKSGKSEPLVYPISNYLKDKLFKIHCVNDGELITTHYTKYWLDFQKKKSEEFLQNKINYYICNQNLKIPESELNDRGFVYVKDVLNYISDTVGCSIDDYFLYYSSYFGRPFLTRLAYYDIPDVLQSRKLDSYYFLDYEIDSIDESVKSTLPYLYLAGQTIAYARYLDNVDRYNNRQNLLALEYQHINRKYKPKYLDILPFSKFVNLNQLSKNESQKNY